MSFKVEGCGAWEHVPCLQAIRRDLSSAAMVAAMDEEEESRRGTERVAGGCWSLQLVSAAHGPDPAAGGICPRAPAPPHLHRHPDPPRASSDARLPSFIPLPPMSTQFPLSTFS